MIVAVLTGFYNKLVTYSGSYGTYQIKAPQSASLPYVTFGLETDRPMGTFASQEAMEDLTFWVNVFSETSTASVATVADLVFAVMDDATLTVSGYTGMKCVREFIGSTTWDMDTNTFMLPIRYRVWLDKT